MEQRVPPQMEWIVGKHDILLGLHLLQLIQRLEAAIGNGLVRERPSSN
ncbi:hypothetical protein [Dictyobacter arantiisoli]|nr:hypothetical protein [Dictyobacter arantiisoli]